MSVDVNVDMEEIDELVDKIEAEVAKMEAKKAEAKKITKANQKEPCQKEEPIYPVRFTIKKSSVAYADSIVEHTFPKLQHSTYTLRTLRLGYVYMYYKKDGDDFLKVWCVKEDGEFQQLVLNTDKDKAIYMASALLDLDKQYTAIKKESLPYILAPSHEDVYIGFTDVLWTSNIANKVIKEEKFRKKIMTKIGVDGWSEKSPDKDTFAIDKLDELVEEYISPDGWKDTFDWAAKKTVPKYPDRTTDGDKKMKLENLMKQVPRKGDDIKEHPVKAIGVMLYDNIGLVKDLGSLIKLFRKAHLEYREDMEHKKIISDFIEVSYEREVSKNTNRIEELDGWKAARAVSNGHLSVTSDEAWELLPYIHKYYRNDNKVDTEEEFNNALYQYYAFKKVNLINEEARLFFKKKYKEELQEEVKKLSKKVVEAKNDRYIHLSSFDKDSLSTDLGCSFLNYDQSYNFETETCENGDRSAMVTTFQAGQSFASCVEGMMDEAPIVEHIINREHEQWETFITKEKTSNFIFDVLAWGFENKIDSLATIFNLTEFLTHNDSNENIKLKEATIKEIEKENIKREQEIEKKKAKSQLKIKKLKKQLELEKSKASDTFQEINQDLDRVTNKKKSAHWNNDKKLKEAIAREEHKFNKLTENLKELTDKSKTILEEDFLGRNVILNEYKSMLTQYSDETISRNIMQFILNRKDLNSELMKGVMYKFNRIAYHEVNKINALKLEFTEEFGKKRVHAKHVQKIEVSRELYLNMKLYNEVNKTTNFQILGKDVSDSNNQRLHIDDRLASEKIIMYVIVDDIKLLELQTNIEKLEKELKILREIQEKKYEELDKTEKDLRRKLENDLEKIKKEYAQNSQKVTQEIETLSSAEKEALKQKRIELKKEMEALEESISSSIDDTKKMTISNIEQIEEESQERMSKAQKKLNKEFHRWVGGVETGANILVLIFNCINLKSALDSFNQIKSKSNKKEKIAIVTNLIGATMGTLSALFGLAISGKRALSLMVKSDISLSETKVFYVRGVAMTVAEQKLLLFGVIASVSDAVVSAMNTWIQFSDENNHKSGTMYLIATVLMTISAGMTFTAMIGYALMMTLGAGLAITVLAMAGVVALMYAEDAKWDALDKWLSRCFFRIHKGLIESEKEKYEDKDIVEQDGEPLKAYHPAYQFEENEDYVDLEHDLALNRQNKKAEITGFFLALNAPTLKVDWKRIKVGEQQVYVGSRTTHMYVKDRHDAKLTIEVKFPVYLDKRTFKYALSTSVPKPSLHPMGKEVNPYRWTSSSLTNDTFKLDIGHLTNRLSSMYLGLSFPITVNKESKELKFYYKIEATNRVINISES